MPVPFIDHQFSTLDDSFSTPCGENEANFRSFPGWNSGSSSSSPFRYIVNRNVVDDTVSPRQVLFHGSYLSHPESYTDDMSVFTFSDSEKSMHSVPEPSMHSTQRRKTGQRSGTISRSSQNHNFQQGRHPLPEGPGQAIPRSHLGGFEPYGQPFGSVRQQGYSTRTQQEELHPELTLGSNGSTPRPSRRQTTSQTQAATFDGPLNAVLTSSGEAKPIFPPGQKMPGFVPIGRIGIAIAAQGNRWPIERNLMEQIVGAERGHGEYRRKTRLTYKEIMAKYSHWDIKESTLRGIKRKITLPKEHRERKPKWDEEHVSTLSQTYHISIILFFVLTNILHSDQLSSSSCPHLHRQEGQGCLDQSRRCYQARHWTAFWCGNCLEEVDRRQEAPKQEGFYQRPADSEWRRGGPHDRG